jgi:hypothetical protein
VAQYVVFSLANSLGRNDGSFGKQVGIVMTPVAVLSFAAVASGLTALKRRPDERRASALAFAGVVIGAVILVLAAAGPLVALTHNPN